MGGISWLLVLWGEVGFVFLGSDREFKGKFGWEILVLSRYYRDKSLFGLCMMLDWGLFLEKRKKCSNKKLSLDMKSCLL